jgi:hypothetical protein
MTLFYKNLALLFILGSTSLLAQRSDRLSGLSAQQISEVATPAALNKSIISLPFFDDFSGEGIFANPNLWEATNQVHINQTWAKSPITLGVATFDGLNEFGRAYRISGGDSICDVLSSLSIDLLNPQDSVYLSFFYQAGGWGELPAGDDSLVVQFWNDSDAQWQSAWRSNVGPQDSFARVMIPVDTSFFSANFKFRFLNYGYRAGAFDIWHIDYVQLDEQRNHLDTLVSDVAFTQAHPSLLLNYESIPWWHFNNVINPSALAKRDLRLFYRRNVVPGGSNQGRLLGEYEITLQGTVLDQNGLPDGDLDDSHGDNVEVRFPVPDTADAGRPRLNFLNPPYADEFSLVSKQYYSGGSQIYSANDTLTKRQDFKNYYAYDDGSAERAYEVLNNRGGFIVQRYDILSNDSLKGIYLYFLPSAIDVSQQEFSIIVLENNSGIPGQILYESDSLYQPQFSNHNFYLPYLLDTTLAAYFTRGTVFIGIRQKDTGPLSLGYDQNRRDYTDAFYGEVDDLYQSFLGATIMMRPIYGYAPRDLSSTEKKYSKEDFDVYPNPSRGSIHINYPFPVKERIEWSLNVRSLNGALLKSGAAADSWDLSLLSPGLYLLEIQKSDRAEVYRKKIIIQTN